MLIILSAPFVLIVILPAGVNLIPYLSEVPNKPPFDTIPFDAPNKLEGFIHASIEKLPVKSIVAEFGTEIKLPELPVKEAA